MRRWALALLVWAAAISGAQEIAAFAPEIDGSQAFRGRLDAGLALDVRLSGMQGGHTLQIDADGGPTLDLALIIDSAFDTHILNDASLGMPERSAYVFPADGDYTVTLLAMVGAGDYTLRLAVPELATADSSALDAASAPLRPLESTQQQLAQFQAVSVGVVRTQQGMLSAPLEEVRVPLPDLRIGDTVYAAVSSANLTPILSLFDSTLTTRYAQGHGAGTAESAFLIFRVEQAGDYVLSFFSADVGGGYELRYGVNTPELQAEMAAPSDANRSGSSRFFVSRGTSAQRFSGALTPEDTVTVLLQGARTGDIVYAAAVGRGDCDPALTLRTRDGALILYDEDGGGGTAALIQYTAVGEGQLILEMSVSVGGEYILHVGINTPSVLDAVGMGDTSTLFSHSEFTMPSGTTREFGGRLNSASDRTVITITGVRPGDTIYAFAEGPSGLDPYLTLYSPNFQYILAEDDDSGGGSAAVIAQAVDQFGDYTLVLSSASSEGGGYRVVVGTNNPAILSNRAAQAVEAARAAGFDCTRADPNGRPVLSGPVERVESPNAVVHYTLSGADATSPAYARALSEAVEKSLDVQFNQLGWRRPPPDCGLGGDDRLDVYVMDIPHDAIGYAQPENMVGDNTHTPEVERYSAFSYLVIENDMDFLQAAAARGYSADPLDLMRVTAAHEVHHAIQFGYDTNESFFGFYESGAMWIETLVYPELSDAYEYRALFQRPDLCLGSRADRLRVYAEWVLIDSFTRDLGPTSYQQLWEYLSTRDNMSGFYEGLELLGTSVEEVIGRMAIRNLLRDYPNGSRFAASVALSGVIYGPGLVNSGERGVQQQAVNYLRVAPGVWRFEVRSGSGLLLRVVGIKGSTAASYTLGRSGAVDTRPYDAAYLIVQNTTRHRQVEDCYFTIWTLDVRAGGDTPLTARDPDVWSAVHYWSNHRTP
jgi:hypothetical protein